MTGGGKDLAHPASQDRAGGPDGPEPATQAQPEALIPCAEANRRLAAVRKVIEYGYPNHTPKVDQCEHGQFGFEDCIACYDDALLRALDGQT